MERHRIRYRADLKLTIQQANKSNAQLEQSIHHLRHSSLGVDYCKHQISQARERITTLEDRIKECEEKIVLLDKGQLDQEINDELSKNTQDLRLQEKNAIKKKSDAQVAKKEKEERGWAKINKENRENRNRGREVRNGYSYFMRTSNKLPNYMKRNLKEMPNNKGYIFRDIQFYGELPTEKGPRVLFEKPNHDTLWIHEWDDTMYRKYEKKGKEKKRLIKKEKRRLLNITHQRSFFN